MAKARTLVGLDVHATTIVAAVLDAETGELRTFRMSGEGKEAAAFSAGLPSPVRAAYEAGRPATGWHASSQSGGWSVWSRRRARSRARAGIGSRPTVRRRASRRLLLAGKLHAVRVPGDEEEALRDLVRARDAVRMDLSAAGQALEAAAAARDPLRRRRRVDAAPPRRLATVALPWPAAQATLLDARGATSARARREQLERETSRAPASPGCYRSAERCRAVSTRDRGRAVRRDRRLERSPARRPSYVGRCPGVNDRAAAPARSDTKTGSGHAGGAVEAAWPTARAELGRARATARQPTAGGNAVRSASGDTRPGHAEARAKRRPDRGRRARELAGRGRHPTSNRSPTSTVAGWWRPARAGNRTQL